MAIWLNSLEYQFRGRDICPLLEKQPTNPFNQPIPQSLNHRKETCMLCLDQIIKLRFRGIRHTYLL